MKPEDKELADRLTRRAEAFEGQSDIPYLGTPEPDGRPGYDAEIDLRASEAIKRLSAAVEQLQAAVKASGEVMVTATKHLRIAIGKDPKTMKVGDSVLEGLAKEAERLLSRLPLDCAGKRIELGADYNEFVFGPVGDRKAKIVVAVAGEGMSLREIPIERYRKFGLVSTPVATLEEAKTPSAQRSGGDRNELLRYLRARRGG